MNLLKDFKRIDDGLIHYSCGHRRPATEADGDVRASGYKDMQCEDCFWEWYQKKKDLVEMMKGKVGLGKRKRG